MSCLSFIWHSLMLCIRGDLLVFSVSCRLKMIYKFSKFPTSIIRTRDVKWNSLLVQFFSNHYFPLDSKVMCTIQNFFYVNWEQYLLIYQIIPHLLDLYNKLPSYPVIIDSYSGNSMGKYMGQYDSNLPVHTFALGKCTDSIPQW